MGDLVGSSAADARRYPTATGAYVAGDKLNCKALNDACLHHAIGASDGCAEYSDACAWVLRPEAIGEKYDAECHQALGIGKYIWELHCERCVCKSRKRHNIFSEAYRAI